ncbi:hypothetical protein GGP77_003159 [Salinibacter ruber]|nr:hypothetical protein [Salinibacter ruber]MCS3668905.1 hypothetical protein [Salinibacter ruber]
MNTRPSLDSPTQGAGDGNIDEISGTGPGTLRGATACTGAPA